MQRAWERAHRAIFDPHGLSVEAKLDGILFSWRHVVLPEGEMREYHNLLRDKTFMTQGVDSEFSSCQKPGYTHLRLEHPFATPAALICLNW